MAIVEAWAHFVWTWVIVLMPANRYTVVQARSGPGQAYYNTSAPSWGGAAIKIGGVYHLWVLTMAVSNCIEQ